MFPVEARSVVILIDASGSMRVYVLPLPAGGSLVVTQDTLLRQDVAMGSALQALVPVLLLIPLVAWLTLRTVRAERAAIERQRRFIAAAAHELRSPLTAMAIQAGNIEHSTDPASARERLAALRAGLDRTRRVAEQLLALARLQTVREARARVELVHLAQFGEQPDADRGADNAGAEQHHRQGNVDRTPAPIIDRAGKRGGGDVAGDARHRDRGRDADEDQQRRHQEAAADAEHPGNETDRQPHREDQEYVHGEVGDGKIDLQAGGPAGL